MTNNKPKILLVDFPSPGENHLGKHGFNVIRGSFGHIYKTAQDVNQFIWQNQNFPIGSFEQNIIVINQETSGVESVYTPKQPETDTEFRTAPINGFIDPTPAIKTIYQDNILRLLKHSGVLIIFSTSRKSTTYKLWKRKTDELKEHILDNWSFLPIFHDSLIEISTDDGTEIFCDPNHSTLKNLIDKFSSKFYFNCTLSPKKSNPRLEELWETQPWHGIIKNKFENSIGGLIEFNKLGRIFIFPKCNSPEEFLIDFITEVLPEYSSHLFYSDGGQNWIHQNEYELPKVQKIKGQIEIIRGKADLEIKEKEKEIEKAREKDSYLQDILTETGDILVLAVKTTLERIGFKDVVNMDDEIANSDNPKKRLCEDIQIKDSSPLLLVEVKGIAGLPSDTDSLQVSKYLFPRTKELNRKDIQGLSIINHQRGVPPLSRENDSLFHEDILTNANEMGFGLLTTWDLYKLIRSFNKNNWTHENIKDIFYLLGRISPVPNHYQHLGIVEEVWKEAEAIGVKIENGHIQKNCKLAFEFPNEFEEQEVTSLQLEGENQDKIDSGKIAGIKVSQIKRFKKKIRVYKVEP